MDPVSGMHRNAMYTCREWSIQYGLNCKCKTITKLVSTAISIALVMIAKNQEVALTLTIV